MSVRKRWWSIGRKQEAVTEYTDAEREFHAELARWQADQDLLDTMVYAAGNAGGTRGGVARGVLLRAGESALWDCSAQLIEPRRQRGYYAGRSSGVSVRVTKGVWYRSGSSRGQYIPGPELQTAVDEGRAVITTARVVFTGSRTTREWRYDKLVGVDADPAQTAVLLHVINRQKVSGLVIGAQAPVFHSYLDIALDILERGNHTVARELQARADAHMRAQPRPETSDRNNHYYG
ncbi:hypothetical protein D5S18_22440 [Nocardia panacis]|uniref:Uncharacterized protein n=1 Tax=Nocardia panacis TaxID=2340916 RepID=A0A3A4JSB8_9NOCA|nr:hypothetical protein [Nocardia panacis]RJO72534.1 hypothetical protein D5S18_22440 [Nocardia panacis]